MIHSFLLIGQSNMAGRGFLQDALPVDISHIKVLRNGRWQPMFRPINPDRPFSGVNLAESFAEQYAKQHDVEVGLICCADGGTTLDQWQKGEVLYDNAVAQAKLAMRSSVLAGVLWHQGESDCKDSLYPTYQQRLEKMLACLRADLQLPQIPVIIGGLPDFLSGCTIDPHVKNYRFINHALTQTAASGSNMAFVPADGLQCNPDKLHICSASLHEFGIRYWNAYESLGYSPCISGQLESTAAQTGIENL